MSIGGPSKAGQRGPGPRSIKNFAETKGFEECFTVLPPPVARKPRKNFHVAPMPMNTVVFQV